MKSILEESSREALGRRIIINTSDINGVNMNYMNIVDYYESLSRWVIYKSDLALLSLDKYNNPAIEFYGTEKYNGLRTYVKSHPKSKRNLNIVSCFNKGNKYVDFAIFNTIKVLDNKERVKGWRVSDVFDIDGIRNPKSVFQSIQVSIETAGFVFSKPEDNFLKKIFAIIMFYSRKINYCYNINLNSIKDCESISIITYLSKLYDLENKIDYGVDLIEEENLYFINLKSLLDSKFYKKEYDNLYRVFKWLETSYEEISKDVSSDKIIEDKEIFSFLFSFYAVIIRLIEYVRYSNCEEFVLDKGKYDLLKNIFSLINKKESYFKNWNVFLNEIFKIDEETLDYI